MLAFFKCRKVEIRFWFTKRGRLVWLCLEEVQDDVNIKMENLRWVFILRRDRFQLGEQERFGLIKVT